MLDRGYNTTLNSMDSIGYKEMIPVAEGKCGLEEGIALLKRNTRRLAKKQMTWFRRVEGLKWLEMTAERNWEEVCTQVLECFSTPA